jgi:hypothetical protein
MVFRRENVGPLWAAEDWCLLFMRNDAKDRD